MNAEEAISHVDPEAWVATSPVDRLHLLEAVQRNLRDLIDEVGAADAAMKNGLIGADLVSEAESAAAAAMPIGFQVAALMDLYDGLTHGQMPEPESIDEVGDGLWDVTVRRLSRRDRLIYGDQTAVLRVKGEPVQVNPMDNPPGIIAVLGAGNYTSALEMVNALFLENCAVVHKPHHNNIESDRVWARIFAPLVEAKAIAFVEEDPDRQLNTDPRIAKLYFTGSTSTAERIMASTDIPLISECGGNNPIIVVPGDRSWTDDEIQHQAEMIVSVGKLNGGAVCGRGQTIVTSRHWPQRAAFLDAVRRAAVETVPSGTYYPGSGEVKAGFVEAYPEAERLQPKGSDHERTELLLIAGAEEDSFATANEAFCQIFGEVPLDVAPNATEFLAAAADFANEHLLGTLGCAILVDEETKTANEAALAQAVTDLEYGGIAINEMPPTIWLNPLLTWGGNGEGPDGHRPFVSGVGNFGNLYNYQNVEKSILTSTFLSQAHMRFTDPDVTAHQLTGLARLAVDPSWTSLARLMGRTVLDSITHRQ